MNATVDWRAIPGWPYFVSDRGQVKNRFDRILATPLHKSGYLNVQLWKNCKPWTIGVHQLVALVFLGEKPTAAHEVAHGDGDKTNNIASNLRWATHLENMADTKVHGRRKYGGDHWSAKYSNETVALVRKLRAEGLQFADIELISGMSQGYANQVCMGNRRA